MKTKEIQKIKLEVKKIEKHSPQNMKNEMEHPKVQR
ncbi:MAG: hypothetical protein FD174_243 [Geobacteraceae bacterium]|nr:MAG: hypothetical protein FD174_243 [Geobacteraceae bacterium]